MFDLLLSRSTGSTAGSTPRRRLLPFRDEQLVSKGKAGQIITFYSYKGGTGRSMALANVACLLARREDTRKILMIDWDLEAPGLHRYFQNLLTHRFVNPQTHDEELDVYPGLIDLFWQLSAETQNLNPDLEPDDQSVDDLFRRVRLENYILSTDIPSLYLMKAGAFTAAYSARVNNFQWQALFEQAPWLFNQLAQWLANAYDYVLIDSRTGVSDISGICTALMPDKLVVAFTPNNQSLKGLDDLITRVIQYRSQSDDLRSLTVFPLPSRVELAEEFLRQVWRYGNNAERIVGYQPVFERLFQDTYRLSECDLQDYFDKVQIQHIPRYAYGEQIAVLVESGADRLSLTSAYSAFATYLTNRAAPWGDEVALGSIQSAIPKAYDVLLSYSRKDAVLMRRLRDDLRTAGLEVWVDEEGLEPGTPDWTKAIDSAIQNVGCVAVLLSPDAYTSEWVERELATAEAFEKRIFPILVRGDTRTAIPLRLRSHQLVDGRNQYEDALEKLLTAIRNYLQTNR